MLIHLHIVNGSFYPKMAGLSSYNRQHMACKAEKIYYLDLFRSVPAPALMSFQQIPMLLKSARVAHHQNHTDTTGDSTEINDLILLRPLLKYFPQVFSKDLKVYPGSLLLSMKGTPRFCRTCTTAAGGVPP